MSRRILTRAAPRPSDRLTPLSTIASPPTGNPEMSFMRVIGPDPAKSIDAKGIHPKGIHPKDLGSYGWPRPVRQIAAAALCTCLLTFWTMTHPAPAQTVAQNQTQNE